MRALAVLLAVVLVAVTLPALAAPPATAATTQPAIHWEKWTDDLFDRAKRENKFVLLDLEAVWCHWCHVMDETTYRDADVVRLAAQKYIFVRVDQDSRPDLSNRYEDYGWPATVVFAPDGSELAKRRGYLRPLEMSSMLQAIIDDPTPGPSIQPEAKVEVAPSAALSKEDRGRLVRNLHELYDEQQGGWAGEHKFVDADVIDYCLTHGDATLKQHARQTLTAALKLVDPAWGGVYQYSTDADWDHPHFEKIMSYQADDMRTWARAYTTFKDPAYLKAAQDIHRFLRQFLKNPHGEFYTSMDADLVPGEHAGEYFALDDAARRKKGIPRIDENVYARENGWAIEALVALYAAADDEQALTEARNAATWIIAHRSFEDGHFAHGDADPAGTPRYLGDTLAMGRACLALYSATAQRDWLTRATTALHYIDKTFASPTGYLSATATASLNNPAAPKPQVDENVSLARFANLLYAYTGDADARRVAETAMKFLASPQVATARRWLVGGILLADRELATEPTHLTVVGPANNATARDLLRTAQSWPTSYKRVELFDEAAGPLPRADVPYPTLDKPAAFLCANGACSSPIFTVEKLQQKRDAVTAGAH